MALIAIERPQWNCDDDVPDGKFYREQDGVYYELVIGSDDD